MKARRRALWVAAAVAAIVGFGVSSAEAGRYLFVHVICVNPGPRRTPHGPKLFADEAGKVPWECHYFSSVVLASRYRELSDARGPRPPEEIAEEQAIRKRAVETLNASASQRPCAVPTVYVQSSYATREDAERGREQMLTGYKRQGCADTFAFYY